MAKNVANRDSFPFSAVGTAYGSEPSLEWQVEGAGIIEIAFENYGEGKYNPPQSSNSFTAKFQEADDPAGPWTDLNDISGGSSQRTVVPKGTQKLAIQISKPYLRMLAYGNASGEVIISWDESIQSVGLRIV